jgi:hypothetical protein
MKRKSMFKVDLETRFRNERMERMKMNYLKGGDGDGGQPGNDDPWDPNG